MIRLNYSYEYIKFVLFELYKNDVISFNQWQETIKEIREIFNLINI